MTDKYAPLLLRNQLCFPLYLCSKEITRRYQPMLDELDLSYTQYVVMMYFWEMKSASATELSRALMLDPSTLTPIIRKLENKGYLMRTRDPRDERSLIIAMTEKGEALRDRALGVPARMAGCMGLSDEEAHELGALIMKIMINLDKEN